MAETSKKVRCPEGHTTVQKIGVVATRTGPKQRFKCVTCARTFYWPPPKKKKGKS